MHTLTNRRLGFTLIELMIVVAIIGILLFQGIPAYEKYQAKARTTEVKSSLAAAYTAEKSFYIEHSTYTACLDRAGFGYEGTQAQTGGGTPTTTSNGMKYYYTVGFTAIPGSGCGPDGNAGCNYAGPSGATCDAGPGVTYMLANATLRSGTSGHLPVVGDLAVALPSGHTQTISNSTFLMTGAGFISKTPPKRDRWTVDHNKNIVQVEVGY